MIHTIIRGDNMKIISMKMMAMMMAGMGMIGYMYLKKHPEKMQMMKDMGKDISQMMNDKTDI